MMAVAKFGIGVIFSFCAALGTPYAAEVHALPSATSALTQRAPSMRANASRCPPASMTANDMGGVPSSAAARDAAAELGTPPMSFAVMDAGGHLLAFARMDGARWVSADVALGKAWTSAAYGVTSAEQQEKMSPMPNFPTALTAITHG